MLSSLPSCAPCVQTLATGGSTGLVHWDWIAEACRQLKGLPIMPAATAVKSLRVLLLGPVLYLPLTLYCHFLFEFVDLSY